MYNDFVVEAETELAIGGVTQCFLLALGPDDPEYNYSSAVILEYSQTNLPHEEDDGMDAERRRHP